MSKRPGRQQMVYEVACGSCGAILYSGYYLRPANMSDESSAPAPALEGGGGVPI